MKKMPTYTEACKDLAMPTSLVISDFDPSQEEFLAPMRALYQLLVIRKSVVGDYIPNWNSYREAKYYPVFSMDGPGFRFWLSDYDITCAGGGLGSRLCFPTREMSDAFGKANLELFRILYQGKKISK